MGGMKLIGVDKKRWPYFLLVIFLGFSFLWAIYFRKVSVDLTQLDAKRSYYIPLKIKGYSSADIPCLELEIEGNKITAEFDLGYEGELGLPFEFLQNLKDKSFLRSRVSYGLGGKKYSSSVYALPRVVIQGVMFDFPEAEDLDLEFQRDITLVESGSNLSQTVHARIGWRLFQRYNLFLDKERSVIALCKNINELGNHGYAISSFTRVPLILDRGLLEFTAIADSGDVRCVLDTGATWNLFNNKSLFRSLPTEFCADFDVDNVVNVSAFKIGKSEFGPISFNQIDSVIEIDTILGMEFLNSVPVFIDFTEREISFFSQ